MLFYPFRLCLVETLKLILDQSRPNFHVGITIKLVATTKEPCLAFSVNHVILCTTQFASTLIHVFSLCWKGLHVLGNVLAVACQFFSAKLFDSVILDSDITITSSEESPYSTPLPTPLLSSSPSKNMQPIKSHATKLRIVAINFQCLC